MMAGNPDERLLDMEDEEFMDITRSQAVEDRELAKETRRRSHNSSESSHGSETGKLPAIYKVIKGDRKVGTQFVDSKGIRVEENQIGSFESNDVGQAERVHYRYVPERNRNISLSFNPSSMKCQCKGGDGHLVLLRSGEKPDNARHPPVFMVSDQNCPAYIPSGDALESECLKVIRIENGTLQEMASVLLDILQGHCVPLGSIVFISSLSHLAHVGVAGYADDLHSVSKRIYERYGHGVKLVHGPTFPCADLDNMTIRAWHDLDRWLMAGSLQNRLETTATAVVKLFTKSEESSDTQTTQPTYKVRFRAPMSVSKPNPTVFEADGSDLLLNSKARFSPGEVATVMEALLRELNTRFHVNLGSGGEDPIIPEEEPDTGKRFRVVVVGGSHSRRLVEALEAMDAEVCDLTQPGLMLSEVTASRLSERLQSCLEVEFEGKTLIVYQLFDNVCYLRGVEDEWGPLDKGEDGKYHALGRIKVARVEEISHLFRPAMGLFRAGGRHKKVIVTPLERYLVEKCCDNIRHMTNYSTEFVKHMEDRLSAIRRALVNHLHLRMLPNYKVVGSAKLMGMSEAGLQDDLRRFWDKDPVHMTGAGYACMAESIVDYLLEEPSSFSNQPKEKSQGTEVRRSSWISGECVGEAGP
ncbi:MAG: hypothetical protein FJ333_08470, partial [Sphingomonadales bacterium]|nr:hypothetical protein [Sphingomonadales bacterium]